MDFYTGRLLRIDLTDGRAAVEPLNEAWLRLYVGGKGLLLRYLFQELRPGTAPLDPESPLLPVTGPFAGTAAPTCLRLAVGRKSPATGLLLDSYVGGSSAPELKFAGYDVLVLQGRSPEPSVVVIRDDTLTIGPGRGYWGMTTSELESALRAHVDPRARVLSVGPAGANLLPTACLSTD
jgi:aldehyde:ferredoxin oxidoreductase